MASKLKKGVNQPGISNFLSYSDSELTDSSIKKKRTPPSIDKNQQQKKYPINTGNSQYGIRTY